MKSLSAVGLTWPLICEVAEFCGVRPHSVYNVAVGFRNWRTTRPMIVRLLYQHKWTPPDGRTKVRLWLNKEAAKAKRLSTQLATAP